VVHRVLSDTEIIYSLISSFRSRPLEPAHHNRQMCLLAYLVPEHGSSTTIWMKPTVLEESRFNIGANRFDSRFEEEPADRAVKEWMSFPGSLLLILFSNHLPARLVHSISAVHRKS